MKIKCYIKALWMDHSQEYIFQIHSFESTEGSSFISVEEQELEFTPPPIEVLHSKTVAVYRAEQEKIRAEAEVKRQNIQGQIDRMLALENKGVT